MIQQWKHSGRLTDTPSSKEIEHGKLARRAAAEGCVLLKNEGILPLRISDPIALFGGGAGKTIKGGIGSGDVNNRKTVSIYEGLMEAGATITSTSWIEDYQKRYSDARNTWKEVILEAARHVENHFDAYAAHPFMMPEGRDILESDLSGASAAIYVVSRIAGEGKDRRLQEGDYYLSGKEKEDLLFLNRCHIPTVLIINAGGPVEITDILEEAVCIKAVLNVSQPGQEAGHAVADILFGKISPSGRLTSTWARRYSDYPYSDSYSYLSFIQNLAQNDFKVNVEALSSIEQKQLLMFYYDLFENAGYYDHLQKMVDELATDLYFCTELKEIITLLLQHNKAYEKPDNSMLPDFPLKLHGIYTKAQIQVAIGTSTLERKSPSREGVERNKALNLEAMFVDIIKNREEGSTTDYDDKALSPNLFQWDTQNRVKPESQEGQAYINQTQTMLLFVREQKNFAEDKSRTMGYVYLGRVTLHQWQYKHVGTRMQMQIVWNMIEPIPGSVMHFARIKEIA